VSVVGKSLIDDFIREAELENVLDTSKYPIDYVDSKEALQREQVEIIDENPYIEEEGDEEDEVNNQRYLISIINEIANNKELQNRPNIKLERIHKPIKATSEQKEQYGIPQNEYAIYLKELQANKISQNDLSLGELWLDFLQSPYFGKDANKLTGWTEYVRSVIKK